MLNVPFILIAYALDKKPWVRDRQALRKEKPYHDNHEVKGRKRRPSLSDRYSVRPAC